MAQQPSDSNRSSSKPSMENEATSDESKDEIIKKLKNRLKQANKKIFTQELEITNLKKTIKTKDYIIAEQDDIYKNLMVKFEILNKMEDDLDDLTEQDENVLKTLDQCKKIINEKKDNN
jgi:hypothetical protein